MSKENPFAAPLKRRPLSEIEYPASPRQQEKALLLRIEETLKKLDLVIQKRLRAEKSGDAELITTLRQEEADLVNALELLRAEIIKLQNLKRNNL